MRLYWDFEIRNHIKQDIPRAHCCLKRKVETQVFWRARVSTLKKDRATRNVIGFRNIGGIVDGNECIYLCNSWSYCCDQEVAIATSTSRAGHINSGWITVESECVCKYWLISMSNNNEITYLVALAEW